MQPINLVTSTSVINNASCNWVNLVQVSSVQFGCCKRGLTGSTSCRSAQISVVQFVCCGRAFSVPLCLSACVSVRRFILLPHSLSLSLKIPPPFLSGISSPSTLAPTDHIVPTGSWASVSPSSPPSFPPLLGALILMIFGTLNPAKI